MPSLNGALTNNNPVVKGVFTQNFSSSGDFPTPPITSFMVTELDVVMVTETGNKMITEQ